MMKSEECQSPIETIDYDTTLDLPQEPDIIDGSAKTIFSPPLKLIQPNPNLINLSEEDTLSVPYIDTPQKAVIIGDHSRWGLNLCACKANLVGDTGVSRAPNPKSLKTLEEIRACKSSSNIATAEVGSFACGICTKTKSVLDSFGIKNCGHAYCSDCVVCYVSCKLQDNVSTIKCPVPDCRGSLEPEHCLSILPPELFLRWGKALCEAVTANSDAYCRIFYCPFKDCSTMLIDDGIDDGVGEVDLWRAAECPHCWRLFCARCKVPWHVKMDYGEGSPSVASTAKDRRVATS